MGEPTTSLLATEAELALLADIDARKVTDNEDLIPMLDLGDEPPAQVAELTWAMYRRGWVHQLEGEKLWRLTWRGRDVMQGRPSDG